MTDKDQEENLSQEVDELLEEGLKPERNRSPRVFPFSCQATHPKKGKSGKRFFGIPTW